MDSPAIKRVAFIVAILVTAMILWEVRFKLEEVPVVVPANQIPTPHIDKIAPIVPPLTHAKPFPKSVAPKQATLLKLPPRPMTNAPPIKSAAPTVQVPPLIAPLPTPPPPPPVEWQGNDTAITHSGEVVIRNDHQWIQFWAEHRPHEAAPDVDFAQSMVIGVFAGSRPADQFTIHMTDIRALAGSLIVTYQEKLPPPGTFAVDVTVYPYELKVIPRTTQPVKFNKLAPNNPNQ